tara:strand:- start:552 stop:1055 length:504 start_codon:yes stop_codon:yes gene_type:complete
MKNAKLASDLLKIKEKPKKKLKQSEIFEMSKKSNKSKDSDSNKNKKNTISKKPKTFKEKYNQKFNQPLDNSNSKSKIAKQTGISINIINEVYDRGIGAYKNNLASVRLKGSFKKNPDLRKGASMRLSKEQWAIARVYAFVIKALDKSEPQNQDLDLIRKVRKKKGIS